MCRYISWCNNRSFWSVCLCLYVSLSSTWHPPSGLTLPLLLRSLERVQQFCGNPAIIPQMIPVAPFGRLTAARLRMTSPPEQRAHHLVVHSQQYTIAYQLTVGDCTIMVYRQSEVWYVSQEIYSYFECVRDTDDRRQRDCCIFFVLGYE